MTAIIFDTETHDREEPQIIEAAWREVRFGSPTILEAAGDNRRFKPSKLIALGALSTHHIMDEDLVNCEPTCHYEPPDCEFLIGHNIDFDWHAAGSWTHANRICTCAIARLIWPGLDCYSQAALIYHLDRPNARERLKSAHGAAADILLCKTILDAIIAATACQSWEHLYEISEDARIPRVMPFGKHHDMPIDDLPEDYVHWLERLPDIDNYLRTALRRRGGQGELF